MEIVLCVAAFLAALAATYARSVGAGLSVVLAVGYVSGVVRANVPGVLTTFLFDLAVLGLYAGFFAQPRYRPGDVWKTPAGRALVPVLLWPILMALVPINDIAVQVVALRANVWYLPVMLLAARLTPADLTLMARVVAGLNIVTLATALFLYQFGIEALYPRNAVTELMYMSRDVITSEGAEYRIPATFLNAHAYGVTMLLSLPFLFGLAFGRGRGQADRILGAAGLAAALGGVLFCGARSPVVLAAGIGVIFMLYGRLSAGIVIPVAVLAGVAVVVAGASERFQRVLTLTEGDTVETRVRQSVNDSFFDLAVQYPFGAGMGSSFGTSIPFFLQDRAPVAIGMENEYARILIDQGLIGLALWVAMLVRLLYRPPPRTAGGRWQVGVTMMYAVTLVGWLNGFIGIGVTTLVPGAVLLLVQMGVIVSLQKAPAAGPAR